MAENDGRQALFDARKNLRAVGGEVSRVGVAGATRGFWKLVGHKFSILYLKTILFVLNLRKNPFKYFRENL